MEIQVKAIDKHSAVEAFGRSCGQKQKNEGLLDNMGILASSLCMIHCLTLPFLISVLPLVGMQFLESDFTHEILAFFVLAFACLAVVPAYLKHKKLRVLVCMSIGLFFVLFATFAHQVLGECFEMPLISIGNIFVVAAHLQNKKLCKC